jgi:hypothetical protein
MDRVQLLNYLPKNSICAEIGVCLGDFSQYILDITNPKELFLVDVWGDISNIYKDKLMADNDVQEKRYRHVIKRFLNNSQVRYIRSFSDCMLDIFPNNYFDWIYIDGDHTYDGCKLDLNIAKKLVKPDGYILGHDHMWKFPGVIDSVKDFVSENNFYHTYTTNDKNSTFLISLNSDTNDQMKIQLGIK